MFIGLIFTSCTSLSNLTKAITPDTLIENQALDASDKVTIEVQTHNEPNLTKILKDLNKIHPKPKVSFEGFRNKAGRFMVTEIFKYYKGERVVATVTYFDGEIISIEGDKTDLAEATEGVHIAD